MTYSLVREFQADIGGKGILVCIGVSKWWIYKQRVRASQARHVVPNYWNTWEVTESVYDLKHQPQLEVESSLLKGLEFKLLK